MAKHIANNASAEAIAELQEFQGSNLRGTWENGVYAVYSYWTLMASFDPRTGDQFINPKKYSRTTSKQMNYVRQGFENIGR
jgi:hypothetical protein